MTKKGLYLIAVFAVVLMMGAGVSMSKIHAQSATPKATPTQSQVKPPAVADDKEVPDANEPADTETNDNKKGNAVDADGPNGHQDPNGVEVADQPGQ